MTREKFAEKTLSEMKSNGLHGLVIVSKPGERSSICSYGDARQLSYLLGTLAACLEQDALEDGTTEEFLKWFARGFKECKEAAT